MNNQNEEQPVKKRGRHEVADKKIQVCFYIETSIVNGCGGMDDAKAFCITQMKTEYERRKIEP